MSSNDVQRRASPVAVGAFVAAVLGVVLVGWLGWRLLTGSADPQSPASQSVGSTATSAGASEEAGELVPLAPGSGVELRLLGWQHAASGTLGSATAVAKVRNVDSPYDEFIVDVAAVDQGGVQILGFGTAQVVGLLPGALGSFTLTIPDGVPPTAQLGVANLWGRRAGDPQIHPINFASGSGARVDAEAPAGESQGTSPSTGEATEPWTEPTLMMVASRFAASVAAMQANCREDQSLAGLVCLSRRNFPDFLLEQPSRDVVRGQPFFHQETEPTGPPRAFDLIAPGEAVACVGQRIDKQTSDQVAILGSCSQRGLYAGDGAVQAVRAATAELLQAPGGAARSSSPVGAGGLPDAPVADDGRSVADYGPTGIGKTVVVGQFAVTVDGVQVGLSAVPQLPNPVGDYTLVAVTVTNTGPTELNTSSLGVTVGDGRGGTLTLVGDGWPPEPTTLAPGASAKGILAMDLSVDQTATTATFQTSTGGDQATVSLLPPPS